MAIAQPVLGTRPERDALWDHSRNALGIARLLAQEGRPASLVATACHVAVESASRAARAQAGLRFEGDTRGALAALAAPPDLWEVPTLASAAERVAAALRVVAWVAAYLRSAAPERAWGY
jgi:hypothetical protein